MKTDCRHPKRLSTTVSSLFGHESGFAPDGKTFYASGTAAGFAAIDVSDPRKPRTIFHQLGVQYHGMRLSDDGRTLYAAHIGEPGAGRAHRRRAADPRRQRHPGPQGRTRRSRRCRR